jgi:hypothetical protein
MEEYKRTFENIQEYIKNHPISANSNYYASSTNYRPFSTRYSYDDSLDEARSKKKKEEPPKPVVKEGELDITKPLVTNLGFKVISIQRGESLLVGILEDSSTYVWDYTGKHQDHEELNLSYSNKPEELNEDSPPQVSPKVSVKYVSEDEMMLKEEEEEGG